MYENSFFIIKHKISILSLEFTLKENWGIAIKYYYYKFLVWLEYLFLEQQNMMQMMLPLLLLDQGSSKTSDNSKLFLAMAMSNPNSMQNPQSILPFLIRFEIVFKKHT